MTKRLELRQFNTDFVESVDNFVIEWDNKYPVDYWWRREFKIPFGSKQHREIDFIDQFIAYREMKMFNELQTGNVRDQKITGYGVQVLYDDEGNVTGINETYKMDYSPEQVDEDFEKLQEMDLSQFND